MQLRDPVPYRPWFRDGKTQFRDKLPDPQHWVSIIRSLEKIDYGQKNSYNFLDSLLG